MVASSERSYLHADSVELAEEEGLLNGRGASEGANVRVERTSAKQTAGGCSRRHVLATVAGTAVLALCAVVAATGNGINRPESTPGTTGRSLLESSELHSVTADLFTKLGSAQHLPRRQLQEKVTAAYGHYVNEQARRNPKAMRLLEAVHLDASQRQGVVNVVQKVGDPNTQSMGQTLAEAVRRGEPGGKEAVGRELEEVSRRNGWQLRKLSEETLPPFMRTSTDEAGRLKLSIVLSSRWHATAEVQPARRLQSNSTTSGPSLVDGKTEVGIEKAINIIGDLVLEAATLLADVDQVCDAFDKFSCDDRLNPMLKAGIDMGAMATGVANCFDSADNGSSGQSTGHFNKVVFGLCAAKYSTQIMQMAEMAGKIMDSVGGKDSSSPGQPSTQTTTAAGAEWAWDNNPR